MNGYHHTTVKAVLVPFLVMTVRGYSTNIRRRLANECLKGYGQKVVPVKYYIPLEFGNMEFFFTFIDEAK